MAIHVFTVHLFHELLFLSFLTSFIVGENQITPEFKSSNTKFALSAYEYLGKESTGRNIFFSPFSISVAMSMVYLGAKGRTANQMEPALFIQNLKGNIHSENEKYLRHILADRGNCTLKIANRLHPSSKVQLAQSFVDLCSKYYHADVKALDYDSSEKARENINQWVSKRTAGKIQELIPPGDIDPSTVMVLVNAIYFKGDWANAFEKHFTRKGLFTNIEGKYKEADMMFKSAKFPYTYDSSIGCEVLEIPYADDSLSMVVILPDSNDDFGKIESKMTSDHLDALLKKLQLRTMDVAIPKFKLQSEFDLSAMFMSMGVTDLFTWGIADLSGIVESNMIHVSNVFHKAYIDVNEEGTEAAAATDVKFINFSLVIYPTFTADHPFLFFIRDKKNGVILFIGRVVDFDGPVIQKDEL